MSRSGANKKETCSMVVSGKARCQISDMMINKEIYAKSFSLRAFRNDSINSLLSCVNVVFLPLSCKTQLHKVLNSSGIDVFECARC